MTERAFTTSAEAEAFAAEHGGEVDHIGVVYVVGPSTSDEPIPSPETRQDEGGFVVTEVESDPGIRTAFPE